MSTPTKAATLTIHGVTIHEQDGIYSLNDLHKASGGENKHAPMRWAQLKRTKSLIAELENSTVKPLKKSSTKGGTFVCWELVYSYAMAISPKFEIEVVRAFHKDAQKKLRLARIQGKAEWHQNRELGILTRHDLTDTIKEFVGYAKAQGSKSAFRYFTCISKAINKALHITDKDAADETALHLLATAELIVECTLLEGMNADLPYKTLYKDVSRKLNAFSGLLRQEDCMIAENHLQPRLSITSKVIVPWLKRTHVGKGMQMANKNVSYNAAEV